MFGKSYSSKAFTLATNAMSKIDDEINYDLWIMHPKGYQKIMSGKWKV